MPSPFVFTDPRERLVSALALKEGGHRIERTMFGVRQSVGERERRGVLGVFPLLCARVRRSVGVCPLAAFARFAHLTGFGLQSRRLHAFILDTASQGVLSPAFNDQPSSCLPRVACLFERWQVKRAATTPSKGLVFLPQELGACPPQGNNTDTNPGFFQRV